MNQNDMEKELIKLKTALSRYKSSNGLVRHQNEEMDKRNLWIIKYLVEKRDYDSVFNYYIDNKIQYNFRVNSTIKDYTNKRGVVSKAHYSAYGNYIGSVKKLGDKPIKVDSWRVPTIEDRLIIIHNYHLNNKKS